MNRSLFIVLLAFFAFAFPSHAHLGNGTVFYEGNAGPYKLRVFIQPPPVVPGRARVQVRIHNGPVSGIGVLPVRWDAGRKGAPPPDKAEPVKGEPGLYSAELWVMDFGAYSVFVDVDGPQGKGTAIVPFNSISTRRLQMPAWMGITFATVGFALVLFLIAIAGAAVRESALSPGTVPDLLRRRRGRFGVVIAAALLGMLLVRGNAWWAAVDKHFQKRRLYRVVEVPTQVEQRGKNSVLVLSIDPTYEYWPDHTPLVADHGRLMHLFLVAEPGMNAFAHLHPDEVKENVFEVALPRLTAGEYTVYADVNHESGLTQTLVSKVSLPGGSPSDNLPRNDESFWTSEDDRAIGSESRHSVRLANGGVLRSTGPLKFAPGREAILRFEADGPDGKPLPLEPYLGMWSHAVVRSRDGNVFTHLHPSGTISIASQELFARRERGEDVRKPIDVVCGRLERELAFPYSFPNRGVYRVWVQVKSGGEVLTGAFDVEVLPAS